MKSLKILLIGLCMVVSLAVGVPGAAAADCPDVDHDGYLDAACLPEGTGDDCNDNDSAIFPGALEICDSIDNNCDDLTDEVTIDNKKDDVCTHDAPGCDCTTPGAFAAQTGLLMFLALGIFAFRRND
jgi:hypothetical protein